jgi:hypothetical protein
VAPIALPAVTNRPGSLQFTRILYHKRLVVVKSLLSKPGYLKLTISSFIWFGVDWAMFISCRVSTYSIL